jgi:hypothetical protein
MLHCILVPNHHFQRSRISGGICAGTLPELCRPKAKRAPGEHTGAERGSTRQHGGEERQRGDLRREHAGFGERVVSEMRLLADLPLLDLPSSDPDALEKKCVTFPIDGHVTRACPKDKKET